MGARSGRGRPITRGRIGLTVYVETQQRYRRTFRNLTVLLPREGWIPRGSRY